MDQYLTISIDYKKNPFTQIALLKFKMVIKLYNEILIIFNLINPNEGSALKIELNTGGQIGLFESKYILSKEIAFKCAVRCLTMGCIPQNDLDLSWEKY